MPPFNSPERGSTYRGKFVRVEDQIFVTENGDYKTPHLRLAEQHEILDSILHLKIATPNEVDGGFLQILGESILASNNSDTLRIPVRDVASQARVRTVEEIARLSPGYRVFTERDQFLQSLGLDRN